MMLYDPRFSFFPFLTVLIIGLESDYGILRLPVRARSRPRTLIYVARMTDL